MINNTEFKVEQLEKEVNRLHRTIDMLTSEHVDFTPFWEEQIKYMKHILEVSGLLTPTYIWFPKYIKPLEGYPILCNINPAINAEEGTERYGIYIVGYWDEHEIRFTPVEKQGGTNGWSTCDWESVLTWMYIKHPDEDKK